LSNAPYDYNTRAAGLEASYALIPVDDVLLEWADEIVCMDELQQEAIQKRTQKPVVNLKISDNFEYRDKGLVHIIRMHYDEYLRSRHEK